MINSELIKYNDCFAEKWIEHLSPLEWRGKVYVEYIDVPLAQLEHAGCWTDPSVVTGWVHSIQSGVPIPPPVAVLTERGTYYLHDGNHRLEALNEVCAAACSPSLIRVAVAHPKTGYRFVKRSLVNSSTYVIEPEHQGADVLARVTLAVLLSLISLFATALIPGADHSPFFVMPVLAVMLSAWLGGWKGGAIASICSLAGTAYYLLAPHHSFQIAKATHLVHFVLLAAMMGVTVSFMQYIRLHPHVDVQFPSMFRTATRPKKWL